MNSIFYIPASAVEKLTEPSLIVSIKGRYNERPEIDEKHTVLKLTFDTQEMPNADYHFKPEMVDEVLAFVKANPGRDIYFHCTEGACRSYTLARCLGRWAHRADVDLDLDTCEFTNHANWLDRKTCNVWNNRVDELKMNELRESGKK